MFMNTVWKNAQKIAYEALRACETPLGLTTGVHHFVDLWARDSLFATFGATAIGDYDTTKKTIETFLKYQRSDGLVPYRIQRAATSVWKYLGKPRYLPTPIANFRSHQSGGLVLDGGLMTIIATSEYVQRNHDKKFVKANFGKLTYAIDWYFERFGCNLISEWFLCEWADATLKVGKTLYTNVLYAKAVSGMSELAKLLGHQEYAGRYRDLAKKIQQQIQTEFWNGRYFADWIDWKRQDYFASHPNMLAILFGLADATQERAILGYAKIHCWNSFTLETNHPRYPFWRIPIFHHVIGMGDYHNRGCLWLQPGILYAVALCQTGKKAEAKRVLTKISEKIVKYNGIYEVYEKNGSPVNRFFYRAEHTFAWSSGLFLWANDLVFGKK